MSRYLGKSDAVTVKSLLKKKQARERISMVTCYDAAFARLVDASPIDCVLVGDSMGNVILGFESTIPVTMDHMVHHTRAVASAIKRAWLIADMPFLSYNLSVEQALRNAGRLIQEGGAQAVKIEGGRSIAPQVAAIVKAGIPVVGHLGLTPQSVHRLGGYKVQGRDVEEEQDILADARALAEAGISMLVLELVPQKLAASLTQALPVPTIGIGAGPGTDGQVLVLHDMLGFDRSFKPKFLKHYAALDQVVADALSHYHEDVVQGTFPAEDNSFN